MTKRVLDVGNCDPDHAAIKRMIEANFAAVVDRVHGPEDTLAALQSQRYDLVLINRKLDRDYSDGLEIIKLLKKPDAAFRDIPVMLITNYAEHQQLAIAAGAAHGFGKLELHTPETKQRLQAFLA